MKKRVRLTESQFRRLVGKCVKRVLNEAGDIYFYDNDGIPHTTSKNTYRGVPGSVFIWHGEWSDPDIWYEGRELNGAEIEEHFWVEYKEHMKDSELRQEFADYLAKNNLSYTGDTFHDEPFSLYGPIWCKFKGYGNYDENDEKQEEEYYADISQEHFRSEFIEFILTDYDYQYKFYELWIEYQGGENYVQCTLDEIIVDMPVYKPNKR